MRVSLLELLRGELPLVSALQGFKSLLALMQGLSWLGSETFFVLLLPLFYWCGDKTLARRVGFLLLFGDALNACAKVGFALPRPYWPPFRARAFGADTSFGLPSGHAENAFSIWPFLALSARRHRALWLTGALLLACGVALSRVYLGVHFPLDVVGGALLGLLTLAAFWFLAPRLEAHARHWPLATHLLAATLLALMLILLFAFARTLGASSSFRPPVVNGVALGDPFAFDAIMQRAGALWGLWVGVALAQNLVVPRASLGAQILRVFVGLLGVAVIYIGLSKLLPGGQDTVSQAFRFARYAALSLWVTAGAPRLFRKL